MSAIEVAEPAVGGNTAVRPFQVGFSDEEIEASPATRARALRGC
jgi:hypothetical protein